jgi:PAS domain-containing protein
MNEGFCIIEILFDEHEKPLDYIYIEANQAFDNQTVLRNVIGKRMRELALGHEEFWFEIYGKVALTGESVQFEHRAEALGRWYEVYAYRVGQPEDRKVAVIFNDITERKQVEEALQNSKAKLEAALNSMTDAVFISDTLGNFIEFNDAFATFHKFTNKDECAKTLAEYPEFLDVFMADGTLAPLDMWAVPRALRGEIVTDAEYTLRRKDTGETWVGSYSFAPISDGDGSIVGSVVIGRDITELKRAEEKLRQSENQLQTLVKNLKSGVALIDEDGRFTVVNPSFMQIFGLDNELSILNVNSQDWSRWEVYEDDGKLLHVDDHPVRKVAITGKPVKDQLVGLRNPGANEFTWLLVSAEPMLEEDVKYT